MIVGRTSAGATPFALASDTKRAANFTCPVAAALSSVAALIDGGGSATGSQALRALIYDASDNLLATSDEIVVAAGSPPLWRTFTFTSLNGHLLAPAGSIRLALHAGGPTTGLARVYGSDPHGAGGRSNSDTYSDGASSPFGAGTGLTADMSIYAGLFERFSDRTPDETDIYFSRLPLHEAQAVFALGGVEPSSARLVDAGWHGTFTDPETGSVCLVREGTAMEELLGERIKVTTQEDAVPRAVYAYVHNVVSADSFDWDLSLSRLLFGRIGMLANDTVPVVVEVMG